MVRNLSFGVADTRALRLALAMMLMAAALFLSGCSRQNVYSNLTEEQANELIAELASAGITADKALNDEKWGVTVSQGDFAKAVETLKNAGLPRQEFASLCSSFKNDKFSSSPLEQRAMLNCATSQDLSKTISKIPGVVDANVHLVMPEVNALTNQAAPSSASVLIKYRSGFDVRSQQGNIKSFVANAVNGLSYEKVSVTMIAAPNAAPTRSNDNGMGGGFVFQIIGSLLALGLIGFAVLSMLRNRKKAAAVDTPVIEPAPAEPSGR
jgi:type III secretion protein J